VARGYFATADRLKHIRMKRQWLALSRRYQAALQEHLRQGIESLAQPAQRLGRQAVMLGMEAQDVARIHKAALTALLRPGDSSSARDQFARRARAFYSTVSRSREGAGRGSKSAVPAKLEDALLTQRTAQLFAANLRLQRGVVQHKTAEDALKKSRKHYAKLLRESEQQQTQLRRLTRRLLLAQEAERGKISHELHDGVAQTLLGINVRLLTLKKVARGNTTILRKEIASTQRVVEKSVKTIDRFARDIDVHKHA
jgi:signal transduction histidine kinase